MVFSVHTHITKNGKLGKNYEKHTKYRQRVTDFFAVDRTVNNFYLVRCFGFPLFLFYFATNASLKSMGEGGGGNPKKPSL